MSRATYQPRALSTLVPALAQTARTSAKTPSGATQSTQRTMTIMASAMDWKNSIMRARRCVSMRVRAKPKNRANTTSGSIALCAAAAMALLGMTVANQSPSPTGAAGMASVAIDARRWAMSAGSRGRNESAIGATMAANAAPVPSSKANATMARRAVRPEAAASLAALTPTTTRASTSGTTVICRALSQSRPIGWAIRAARSAHCGSNQASSNPTSAPEARPVRIRAVMDMGLASRFGARRIRLDGRCTERTIGLTAAPDKPWVARTPGSRSCSRRRRGAAAATGG